MSTVTLKNLKKVYGRNVVAVEDVNIEVRDKEFLVLVGPSGCGKSTTLRMVAGLEEITDGEIYIDDEIVNHVPPSDRDIAMVFQNYALYPHMTVYENMAFSLRLRKDSKQEIDRKVREAADILDITDLLFRKPKTLSGGERQRVAIGRAIVRQPKVFLMDEPLSNVDAKLRNQMRSEIIKLRKRINTTFIYVTHDQTEAMTLGDRIVVMKDGYVQQVGTPDEVFRMPVNLFVAGFIGVPQMNFVPAELKISNGKYVVQVFERELMLSDTMQQVFRDKKQPPCNVKLGLRAEHIKAVPKETPNSIKAQVDVSELMGSEAYVHAKVGEEELIIRVPVTDAGQLVMVPGKKYFVNFIIPPRYIHLFDEATHRNLLL